jgi:hypothetical protein
MAKKQTRARAERLTHPLLEKLGPIPAAAGIFVHSVKIVCGKQPEASCCCVAGVRPGVYATEVNIQSLDPGPRPAMVVKAILPLINSGAVVAREPKVAEAPTFPDPRVEVIQLPPFGAMMDDCCRIAELVLGGPPSGDTGLTIAILTIVSVAELSVSAVYTANPLSGDGISIDVEYIPPRRLGRGGPD